MAKGKKEQLKQEHENKLMKLYDTYYSKCLEGDTQSFKAFVDCSKELFNDTEENEIMKILENAKVGD